jgi:ABC-type antimicrobial peptide transport system permease subunit
VIKIFLDNMVFSATFILLMLSTLLIYSLMIGDVEEKTYEFGMLRALGFNKRWLVVLLFLEALVFAIPGLALGLLTSYLLNSIVAVIIFGSTLLYSSY